MRHEHLLYTKRKLFMKTSSFHNANIKYIKIAAEYFPLGLAKEKSFCNRVQEQATLKRNIELVLHTVLVSPRRYGKSSLATKVLEDSELPYEIIDLFVAKNIQAIEKYILTGIQQLISKIITVPEQAIKFLKTILKHLDVKVVIGTNGFNIEFSKSNNDAAGNILDALQALDRVLAKKKTKAILFIDEFQQVGALAKGRGIEGAIRHVAQASRNLVFIFSGSNRHLLSHMFHDSNRPFYKLCQDMHLQRISAEDYAKFLNPLSQKAWGASLPDKVLTEIFNCAELHPYYMNALGMRIWLSPQKPTPESVRHIWEDYVLEEKSKTINELNKLSANQYFMLNAIAHSHRKQLTSFTFLNEAKIPSSSVIQALAYLEKSDYIYKEEKGGEYFVTDPLTKSSLLMFA